MVSLAVTDLFNVGLNSIRATGRGGGKFGIINDFHYHAIEWRDGEL
jgi:hypothetical protein